jgi:hypothetical protein
MKKNLKNYEHVDICLNDEQHNETCEIMDQMLTNCLRAKKKLKKLLRICEKTMKKRNSERAQNLRSETKLEHMEPPNKGFCLFPHFHVVCPLSGD